MNKKNNLLDRTSKEHLTSSTVGHIISGSPGPRGVLSSDKPDDIEDASSAIHFSSNEPRDENCNKARINYTLNFFLAVQFASLIPCSDNFI